MGGLGQSNCFQGTNHVHCHSTIMEGNKLLKYQAFYLFLFEYFIGPLLNIFYCYVEIGT